MSGGQKQRVSIARALYAQSEIMYLDDVLSAVDVKVGRKLFSNLKNLTRQRKSILVMTNHQLQFSSEFDRIIVLSGQKVEEQGSYVELDNKDGLFTHMLKDYVKEDEKHEEESTEKGTMIEFEEVETLDRNEVKMSKEAYKFIKSENVNIGRIEKNVWLKYLKAMGYFRFSLVVFGFVTFVAVRTFGDFWLGNSYLPIFIRSVAKVSLFCFCFKIRLRIGFSVLFRLKASFLSFVCPRFSGCFFWFVWWHLWAGGRIDHIDLSGERLWDVCCLSGWEQEVAQLSFVESFKRDDGVFRDHSGRKNTQSIHQRY